ncbi:hypothetical protein NOV78_11940 [Klebsiella pneumoniae]|uniref:hypothetical protein n=1 Tax=Klebsiella pneumoniae TaxID=573 RepID=UPI000B9B5CAA|nr:hypothetical protein [Klebsiella pneumoniae]HDT1329928.1 hypothetical protein [Klebsiella pneumoniae subsp. pneumoniae]AVW78052.1 hypothetical protein B7D34_22400 [Klebsiella pneumoniae]MCM6710550.1 hypothetical protein [Klebsiella pneumoniae]MCX0260237.1 hypothetical protein [Klebsiella pneumoniae]MCX0282251.1 hypothetical protein [Klebsiella pneumoniae]
MTDITELAQREKFEAWAEEVGALPWGMLKKHRNQDGSYPGPHYTYMWKAWQAASAELVEALEKAQRVDEELCKLLPPGAEYMDPPDGGDVTPLEGVRRMVADYRQRIADLESRTVTATATAAAADVLAERKRQVTADGWTPGHDDEYEHGELADAAGCYALSSELFDCAGEPPRPWPWPDEWWKPTNRRRDLVKAGALILAEIERLDRAAGIKWEAE